MIYLRGYTYTWVMKMNLKFGKKETLDIIFIVISSISILLSFVLNLEYLSWIAIILCGIPIFKECIEGLITEFDIKADLLVTIAIIASISIGETFAAGEIATIMAVGGFLEEYTVSKTQSKIEELVKLTPHVARRIKNGTEEEINIENVKIGDVLKVIPGENIPTDGIIVKGETSIDQSTLTGESLPVDKKENGERVLNSRFKEIEVAMRNFFSDVMLASPVIASHNELSQTFEISSSEIDEVYWQVEGGAVLKQGYCRIEVLLFPDVRSHSVTVCGKYKSGLTFRYKWDL